MSSTAVPSAAVGDGVSASTADAADAADAGARWAGGTCLGCGGTGRAYFSGYAAGSAERGYVARCPACNGHGREP